MRTKEIIDQLQKYNTRHKQYLDLVTKLGEEVLVTRPSEEQWNILEIAEHLNRYAEFYLPAIATAVGEAKKEQDRAYRHGWLGNKFAMSMLPKEGMKKMQTFKSKNPRGAKLDSECLIRLSQHLEQLDHLLSSCKGRDLASTRTATTIPLTRLKLGDTLRVVVYHHERHFQQMAALVSKYA